MTRGVAALGMVLSGLLVLTACQDSTTAADLPVRSTADLPRTARALDGPGVTGTIVGPTGQPVPGATLYVQVDLTGSEETQRAVKAAFSLGLGCFDEQGCSAPDAEGQAAADGTFAVRVPGKTDEPDGGLIITAVAARPGKIRVATSLTLPAAARQGIDLTTLPLPTSPSVVSQGTRRSLTGLALPGATLGKIAVTLAPLAATDQNPYRRDPLRISNVSNGFDARIAEDQTIVLQAARSGTLRGRPVLISASLLATGTTQSTIRGAPCRLIGSQGQAIDQPTCGLTDGILDESWTPVDDPRCAGGPCQGPQQRDARDSIVTPTQAVPARLLVVRGCGFTCRVFVRTAGGERELPEPNQSGDTYVANLPGTPIRAVRVRTATGGFLTSLREVSLFTR